MSESVLVIVPRTYGVSGLQGLDGLRVVPLDEMLFAGFAGVYFRRLLVQAALNPVKRVEFESKRKEYLRCVLEEKKFPAGTVYVGSRATDVDLMTFDSVYAVRVSDRGLRDLGRTVYGDPVLLYMDYMNVLAAAEEAVDEILHAVDWAEIPLLVMRKFPKRAVVDTTVHVSRQRSIIAAALGDEHDAQVWLEDAVYRSGNEKRTLFLADYDYLSFVRPVWRDAVVRSLGKAPSVTEVFRLPWYVVDTGALSMFCYRPNAQSMPTASSRGYSLIQFVQTRLAGALTTREMVGTWIGGLLCDDLTAVDTIATLGKGILASGGISPGFDRVDDAVEVPPEYMWMYEGVHPVVAREWDGERRLDNSLKVDLHGLGRWAFTLPFAELYNSVAGDPLMSACVVQFLSRLHQVSVDGFLYRKLLLHACDIVADGSTQDNFDSVLTPMLPGYNYLAAFAPGARLEASQMLGCNPGLTTVLGHATLCASADAIVSVEEVCADAVRTMLFAGSSLFDSERVGLAQLDPIDWGEKSPPGFCYECLFEPRYRLKVRKLLRAYPTFRSVTHWRMIPWYIDGALDKVFVSRTDSTTLHMQIGGRGLPLRQVLGNLRGEGNAGISPHMRVGQAGVCYSGTWYVAAIIGWTIVGCAVFGILLYFLYLRFSGASGGSSSRRRY